VDLLLPLLKDLTLTSPYNFVAKAKPALSQVVVPSEDLDFLSSQHHKVDYGLEMVRLLGLLADVSDDQVV
jgi:hypothetical protein